MSSPVIDISPSMPCPKNSALVTQKIIAVPAAIMQTAVPTEDLISPRKLFIASVTLIFPLAFSSGRMFLPKWCVRMPFLNATTGGYFLTFAALIRANTVTSTTTIKPERSIIPPSVFTVTGLPIIPCMPRFISGLTRNAPTTPSTAPMPAVITYSYT